ncbi:filamentous hemagglutinin N-terminal domain-containing protein [Amaricoccus sp.]|uniref:two-partner secretion domain-containing protein n=1 Tax=Amaricoccus sp. TaxID=1872485 RepID=UPI0026254675|nr:filamentous hemagglutinin N-terminal domain-containing protein [Amaricoccus sp.]HRO10391.1 filamentous hemagglutinin N-terminal domain-containing protein [Amaricoccus sp.]
MTRTEACFRFALLASTALCAVPAHAGDRLPVGGSVAHGSVDISAPAPNAMAIRQSSSTAIVNWRGFSIGEGARVDIRQPSASAAMLNRVTGSTPSTIAGQLNANGQVYLVNPNGIAITASGTVRTGAFVASTLATSDEDFIAGRRSFAGKGRSAAVVNQGAITVGKGGYAALIGGRVDNAGTISAEMGRIGLGAGERATLDVSGDGFLQIAVPSGDTGDDGPLIRHSGRLSADGGRVELKAATARQVARQVINLSGVVEARSVGGRSGAIVLGGGAGGTVRVSGRLDASAPRAQPALAAITPPPPRPSGAITITGAAIELAGATLDASGPAGGGSVRIGGDWQGGGALPRALTTTVDGATTIAADALDSGDGGSVVVWSDGHTRFDGRISARGGPLGGDGGMAEVSGKARLSFTGIADLSAPRGALGTLLLDPGNIVISDGATTGEFVDADEDGGVTLAAIPVENAAFEPAQADSILNAADLVEQLEVSNVLVASSFAFAGDGNITVEAPLAWDAGTTLSLQAFGNILIANSITARNGGLTLTAGFANEVLENPQITTSALGAIDVGTFTLEGGDWIQNMSPLPAFRAANFQLQGNAFLRVLGGNGTPAAPYLVADVYGLQGVGSAFGDADPALPDLSDSYALAGNIDAVITSGWDDFEGGEGFEPIGEIFDGPTFDGSFQGNGFTISNLFINRPFASVGLFEGVGFGGVVDNVMLSNARITGGDMVGGLAAENDGVISRARMAGGTVTGISPDQTVDFSAGGLVGQNNATVTQSFSTAAVTGVTLEASTASVGGLVGANVGTVSDSYAAGPVSAAGLGEGLLGGLVGENEGEGTVLRTYARGSVDATGVADGLAGGLVGQNAGLVDQSYAVGAVSGAAAVGLGGLVGGAPVEAPVVPVFNSFWDSVATGQADSAGGGTPLTTADFQDTEGFMARPDTTAWSFTDTWAPPDPGHYPELYSVSPVIWADVGDATGVYGTPGLQPPVVQNGGSGTYVFDPTTTETAVPLVGFGAGGVGSFEIAGAPSVTSAGNVAYRVVSTPGTLTVTPAPLVITADDQVKRYGRTLGFQGTEFTSQGLVSGDSITGVDLASAGTARAANVGEGPFAITASNARGVGLANYAISYEPGTLAVTPAPLVVRADDQVKRFGQTFVFAGTEFTTQGLVDGDRVASVLFRSDGAPAGALPSFTSYPIFVSDAAGTGLSFGGVPNYDISYVPGEMYVLLDPSQLPTFNAGLRLVDYYALRNPSDVIEVAGTESFATGTEGGPMLGPDRGTGTTLARETAADTLSFLESLATRLEARVSACNPVPPSSDIFLACVRDALAEYASQIDGRILDLPEPLRQVSAVIRESASRIEGVRADAARRLALATTDAERAAIEREAVARAGAVMQSAVVEIRQAIQLIRAEDDPQLASLQSRQGVAITAALQNVEDELTRAVGL